MLKNLLKLLFPTLCYGCNSLLLNNEKMLCATCIHNLPYTNHHLLEMNHVKGKFYGIIDIQFASSMLYFQNNGIVQRLIHQLKYKGKQEIGTYLAENYALDLKDIDNKYKFDLIIPVPLHPKKIKKRGYNQVETFCLTLSKALQISYNSEILFRKNNSKTQTRKNKNERFENTESFFDVIFDETFHGKHFLLVDDVITTGATIESCVKALLKIPNAKVSVITLAYTQS